MISINTKTLQDLQFQTVLETISELCITEIGTEKALAITPHKNEETLLQSLHETSEYRASFDNNNALPNHGFEPITNEIKFLGIEDSFLEAGSFKKIHSISENNILILQVFKKILN